MPDIATLVLEKLQTLEMLQALLGEPASDFHIVHAVVQDDAVTVITDKTETSTVRSGILFAALAHDVASHMGRQQDFLVGASELRDEGVDLEGLVSAAVWCEQYACRIVFGTDVSGIEDTSAHQNIEKIAISLTNHFQNKEN